MREWGRILARSMIAIVVLAGAYLAVAWWTGRAVPAALVVEGVSVGGMTTEQATERLQAEFAAKVKAPIRVDLAGTNSSFSLEPATAGLTLDLPGTLAGLSGFTVDPSVIWNRLSGRPERPLLVHVDQNRLSEALTAQAAKVQSAPVDGTVSFVGGKVVTTPAHNGLALHVDDAARKITQAWPRVQSVTADATVTEPKVTQAKLDAAVRTFATPAMSGPVTIVIGDKTAAVTPEQYAGALSMVPDATGALAPVVDTEALRGVVVSATSGFVVPAQNASIVLEGGAPVVRPSVAGVAVDTTPAADLLVKAMTAPDRRMALSLVPAAPALTTEAAQALGVKELVATFDSTFPNNPDRTVNLTTAANTINGTLIKPGEVFSLNGILGERTAAKGYREAGMILNGRLVKATGGGVSQISTVIYNLAWFSGVALTEHQAHSFYISRYPAGREATVNWPTIDNKWTNTTPYGMLVQMWVSGSQVHGRMWSTKVYDVEAIEGPRTNPRPGKVIRDSSAGCVPQSSIVAGFDITVKRVIRKAGAVVKTESYTTKYDAEDQVICTSG
ncbi:MAG: VanW family protein [Actinomycetales bacterium]|nr:VanW family protein [Candidatus Phosphoribacter baldrii]MBK6955642.1 VanW family protein [Candidatus Phosphoribacter baldrii]